jgi:hypothetical protein
LVPTEFLTVAKSKASGSRQYVNLFLPLQLVFQNSINALLGIDIQESGWAYVSRYFLYYLRWGKRSRATRGGIWDLEVWGRWKGEGESLITFYHRQLLVLGNGNSWHGELRVLGILDLGAGQDRAEFNGENDRL